MINALTYIERRGKLSVATSNLRERRKPLFGGAKTRGGDGGQSQIKKATFEITKKKEVGVSDLTLLSKVSNEAINDNLKKRFEHGEIYVCRANIVCS